MRSARIFKLIQGICGLVLSGSLLGQSASFAGLWVGSARVNAVSEPQSGPVAPTHDSLVSIVTNQPPIIVTNALGEVVRTNLISTNYLQLVRTNIGMTPTPTRHSAALKLILHVNTNNEATFLKEVVALTVPPMPPDKPSARLVLLSDPSLYAEFASPITSGKANNPIRISTTQFDFPGHARAMMGKVGTNQNNEVSTTLHLSFDAPTNPFRHKYHPDHDNLDAHFSQTQKEAYDIIRNITLKFSPTSIPNPETGFTNRNFGTTILQGVYSEVISGLMRTNIAASGTFTLQKVTDISELNDGRKLQ